MIFISHKSEPDHPRALQIAGVLGDHGISSWLAPESVPPGADFAQEIPRALITCEYFLLILSEEAQNSIHVRKEIGIAQNLNKPFIILKVGDFPLSYTFQYLLQDNQFMPFDWANPDYGPLIEKCRLGERQVDMEISQSPRRAFHILRGDFQENMEYLISRQPEALAHTVFAMGIDRSGDLGISSNKGIVKWVCKHLQERYGIPLSTLQQLTDRAKAEQLGLTDPATPLRFRDTVLVRLPITLSDGTQHLLKLMFIANSQKNSNYAITGNVDEVEGVDSREIIIEVFNQCRQLGEEAHSLFIGAMGTNGLSFPYEVITAEILNCFVFAQRRRCMPRDLYYSVREADMKSAGLTTDEILSYISKTVTFFSA